MLPVRWDPIKELSTFHREIDDFFRRTFGLSREEVREKGITFSPLINTSVKGDTFNVEAELPGVEKKDIEVTVEGNVLILHGERRQNLEMRENEYIIQESSYGSFVRRIALPEGVDTEKIHASFDNGLLKVSMPLEKKAITGRKIQIEGSETGGMGTKH